MVDLDRLLDEVLGSDVDGVSFEREGRGLLASLPGGRRQRVRYRVRDGELLLTSVVASATVVPTTTDERAQFIRRLWEINVHIDLVAFGIDGKGRVVGTCTHPVETLDRAELESYLLALVRECDRLEWVMTGADRW